MLEQRAASVAWHGQQLQATDVTDSAERHGDGVTGRPSVLLHEDTTRAIIGAMYAVHSELGYGFVEAVYKNALTVLLRNAGIRVEREVPYEIIFHGEEIGRYRADLIVESKVVVEVKTGRTLDIFHLAQLRNYLKASKLEVGLLLNFGPSAEFKRLIWTPEIRSRIRV